MVTEHHNTAEGTDVDGGMVCEEWAQARLLRRLDCVIVLLMVAILLSLSWPFCLIAARSAHASPMPAVSTNGASHSVPAPTAPPASKKTA